MKLRNLRNWKFWLVLPLVLVVVIVWLVVGFTMEISEKLEAKISSFAYSLENWVSK